MNIFSLRLNGAAQQVTGSHTKFQSVTFFGYSGYLNGAPVNNNGTAYIGNGTVFPMVISAGNNFNFDTPKEQFEDLSNFYASGTSGDGLTIMYL